ncbi:MAG: AsmA family protein [Phycisphaeraceae bacterium]|nr:AsmA family protein [Phycisphaeraceae bacterium]
MKKILLIIGVLIALAIAAIIALFIIAVASINTIAKTVIEQGGTYALGVPTSVNSVDVSLRRGTFAMEGFTVANPGGFETPSFLSLGETGLSVSTGSIGGDVIEVPSLTLRNIDIALEKRDGRANYQTILDNLKRLERGDATKPADPDAAEGPKFVIREVLIEDISVTVDLLPIGGSLTRTNLNVDRLRLENVGSAGDPLPFADLVGVLVKAVLAAIVEKGGSIIPADMLGELQNGLAQLESLGAKGIELLGGAGEHLGGVLGQVTGQLDDAARGIGGAASGAVEDAGRKAGDALEGAARGLGGLLGGGRDRPKPEETSPPE